jgi:hypothetical protein
MCSPLVVDWGRSPAKEVVIVERPGFGRALPMLAHAQMPRAPWLTPAIVHDEISQIEGHDPVEQFFWSLQNLEAA